MSGDEQQRGLESKLLDLGREDDIPLGEAVNDPEIQRAAGGSSDTPEIRGALTNALTSLIGRGLIVVSRGRALDAPTPVTPEEATELLRDPESFSWGQEENETRVFFSCAESIPPTDH